MKHSAKVDGRPAFQFYPDAWMSDAGLRLSSLAARGLWADMLCLMFDSPERGVLRKQNGSKIESKDLAKMTGASQAEIEALLAEMDSNGVYSKAPDGAIYCRRMVREEHIRKVRSEAGSQGGRPSKSKAKPKAEKTPPSPSPSPSPSPVSNNDASAEPPAPAVAPAHIVPDELKGLALYEADAKLCFDLPQMLPNWRQCYPGVDLLIEIRKAHAWEMANPKKRKTPRGRMKFLNSWMDRAQNDGRNHGQGQAGTGRPHSESGRTFATATEQAGKFAGR